MHKHHIVLGLGYGDEGKGKTVSYLCSKHNADLVIRYNGGAQAAHNVYSKGKFHTFRQFGSGSLNCVPTFYSENCNFEVQIALQESQKLKQLGLYPRLYVSDNSPVITYPQLYYNRITETYLKHGSCGLGVWECTLLSEKNKELSIYFKDIVSLSKEDLTYKYNQQHLYYLEKFERFKESCNLDNFRYSLMMNEYQEYCNQKNKLLEIFLHNCNQVKNSSSILSEDRFNHDFHSRFEKWNMDIVYEGAQGHLLSAEYHNITPHVSSSVVNGSQAYKIANKFGGLIEFYGVIRSYMSRHGNGPLSFEFGKPIEGSDSDNPENIFQGRIRTGYHCKEVLKESFLKCSPKNKKEITNLHLVINHLDQQDFITANCRQKDKSILPEYLSGKLDSDNFKFEKENLNELAYEFSLNSLLTSNSPESDSISRFSSLVGV